MQTNTFFLTLMVAGFFGLVGLYISEVPAFGNTFDIPDMLLLSVFIGLLLSTLIFLATPKIGRDALERIQWAIFLAVLFPALSFPAIHLWNRKVISTAAFEQSFVLVRQEAFYQSRYGRVGLSATPDGYRTWLRDSGDSFSVVTPVVLFPDAMAGDTVVLRIRQGSLGFPFFDPKHPY